MKRTTLIAMVCALALVMGSAHAAMCVLDTNGDDFTPVALLAGQNIDAGYVDAYISGDNLLVVYTTTNGWELLEAHLWVGLSIANMPQTRKGNPVPGQFPYKWSNPAGATQVVMTVPLPALNFICPDDDGTVFAVAAHAALRKLKSDGTYQTETGWGDGKPLVDKGNWGTYFSIVVACDCNGNGGDECETAWAYHGEANGDTLKSLLGENTRWGWFLEPQAAGEGISYALYAACGQNDISKGSLVGSVNVAYADGAAVITVVTDSPFTLKNVQMYAGSAPLPTDNGGDLTCSPGQFPVKVEGLNGVSSVVKTIDGLSGDIYIAVHADVCGF